jgi:hypothetical protein
MCSYEVKRQTSVRSPCLLECDGKPDLTLNLLVKDKTHFSRDRTTNPCQTFRTKNIPFTGQSSDTQVTFSWCKIDEIGKQKILKSVTSMKLRVRIFSVLNCWHSKPSLVKLLQNLISDFTACYFVESYVSVYWKLRLEMVLNIIGTFFLFPLTLWSRSLSIIYEFSPYLKENTTLHHYNDQLVNTV